MTVMSHILATFLLGKVLRIKKRKVWILMWLFGVLIDLDGVIFHPEVLVNSAEWYYHYENPRYLRTFIQEPISLIWVLPLSIFGFKTLIPVLAFFLHLLMDYIEIKIKKPFWPFSNLKIYQGILKPGSKIEIVVSSFLLLLLSYEQIKRKNSSFRAFFRRGFKKIRKLWA
jgi:hypothetical protein